MSKSISMGPKKKAYKSIRLAAEAAGVPYMTFYTRIRKGAGGLNWKASTAFNKPVRKYVKKQG